MSRAVNEAMINGLVADLAGVDSCVVIGPRNLSVLEDTGLRRRLREHDIKLRLIKNSLARLAFEQTELAGVGGLLDGPSAVLYGGEGASLISKLIVAEAAKLKKKIVIHGGYSEGELLDAEGIDALSRAPSREQALAMVMGSFFGPVNGLAGAMDGLLGEVHGLIEALGKKREEAGADPSA